MENPQSSSQQSSLDSLRTVEFRQTLRGYHIEDVDDYLERVAVEAEALQEQLRQGTELLRQAAERISALEQQQQQTGQQAPTVTDDSLQRTLILAQRFVDQTQSEAEAQAKQMVADAEERSHNVIRQAEERARLMTEEAERSLREEVTRLEGIRSHLANDVETIARHLEGERNRLRGALTDMVAWVDEHIQPAASLLGRPPAPSGGQPHPRSSSNGDDQAAPPAPPVHETAESQAPAPASNEAGSTGAAPGHGQPAATPGASEPPEVPAEARGGGPGATEARAHQGVSSAAPA